MKTTVIACALCACTHSDDASVRSAVKTAPLKAAKILIEHNATDGDTGFQVFADGEPWQQLTIANPDGEIVFTAQPSGSLAQLGMTEMFLETNEPPNDEVPIPEVLAHLPAGTYEVSALGVDGIVQQGNVALTHQIPEGPNITSPADGAKVSAAVDLVIAWDAVCCSLDGAAVDITHYQIIVSRLDESATAGFGHEKLDLMVPDTTTSVRIPHELLARHAKYEFEVLALESSGNQTLSSAVFSTL